ncbi:MAG: hypothetical protein ACLTDR_08470 [Adlercreutzia equolifaciens]
MELPVRIHHASGRYARSTSSRLLSQPALRFTPSRTLGRCVLLTGAYNDAAAAPRWKLGNAVVLNLPATRCAGPSASWAAPPWLRPDANGNAWATQVFALTRTERAHRGRALLSCATPGYHLAAARRRPLKTFR